MDAVVSPDGTFQFSRVGPGTYSVLANILLAFPSPTVRIEAKDIDAGLLEMAIGRMIVGQVTVEDGSPLPSPLNVTRGNPSAGGTIATVNTPSLVELVAIRSSNPLAVRSFGGIVRADGGFVVINFQPGEYRIAARVPFGYTIKSLTYGDIDLLKSTLNISDAASAAGSVRMVLSKIPPSGTSGGVKVSGRVTGAIPANARISMQTGTQGSLSPGLIGETLVRPDGTFEFQGVPPGSFNAQLLPRQGLAPQVAIVVENVNVANVEIQNGVTVAGRVVMPTAANVETPRTMVLFGPRNGMSIQGPIHGDGTFELQNVTAGDYDARTLPSMVPPVSTHIVVGDKDLIGITLNH